jgi:GNAT superfamily N-acetyltransferase
MSALDLDKQLELPQASSAAVAGGRSVALVIGQLPLTGVKEAVAVLTRAFMPDPIFSYFFPETDQRAEVFRTFFNDMVRAHIRFGHVYAAVLDENLVAAAVWRPPDAGEPTTRDRRRQTLTEKRVRAIDSNAAAALFEGFAMLESGHPAEPHWYLFFTGVEPNMQGRGIGSRLLAPVLEMADRSRAPCYLETPFPRTHEFYRRQGFAVATEGHPFVGAPALWSMTRSPK